MFRSNLLALCPVLLPVLLLVIHTAVPSTETPRTFLQLWFLRVCRFLGTTQSTLSFKLSRGIVAACFHDLNLLNSEWLVTFSSNLHSRRRKDDFLCFPVYFSFFTPSSLGRSALFLEKCSSERKKENVAIWSRVYNPWCFNPSWSDRIKKKKNEEGGRRRRFAVVAAVRCFL